MTTLQKRLAQIKTGYTPPGPKGFTPSDIFLLICALTPTLIILFSILFGGKP